MKILLVNDFAKPAGGSEVQSLALRDALRKRGHDARLFASNADCGSGNQFADYECFGTNSRFRTLLQVANLSAFWELRRVLSKFQPDIVHVKLFLTQLSPLILPLLRGTPCLFQVVMCREVCPMGLKMFPNGTICRVSAGVSCLRSHCLPLRGWLPSMAQRWLFQRWRGSFDKIIANSEALKQYLIADGIEPVQVVWNGVPVRPLRAQLSDAPTVAFAGRLVWEKGADLLLRAFDQVAARIPNARLMVVGDGPERGKLQKQVEVSGLASRVLFFGFWTRTKMERLFAEAWVQVVPSRCVEGFGNVAAEAMMRGTAVIASAIGGLPEIIRDKQTGILVPSADPDALALALLRLLGDRSFAEQMGNAGHRYAILHLNGDRYVERIEDLYYETLMPNRRVS